MCPAHARTHARAHTVEGLPYTPRTHILPHSHTHTLAFAHQSNLSRAAADSVPASGPGKVQRWVAQAHTPIFTRARANIRPCTHPSRRSTFLSQALTHSPSLAVLTYPISPSPHPTPTIGAPWPGLLLGRDSTALRALALHALTHTHARRAYIIKHSHTEEASWFLLQKVVR